MMKVQTAAIFSSRHFRYKTVYYIFIIIIIIILYYATEAAQTQYNHTQ